jgi:hypothetical protein
MYRFIFIVFTLGALFILPTNAALNVHVKYHLLGEIRFQEGQALMYHSGRRLSLLMLTKRVIIQHLFEDFYTDMGIKGKNRTFSIWLCRWVLLYSGINKHIFGGVI